MQTSEKVIGHNKICRPPKRLLVTARMQSRLFIEWAVKSHGCDMKFLRLVRGFHVVPVDRAIKTIIGYDLNLSD